MKKKILYVLQGYTKASKSGNENLFFHTDFVGFSKENGFQAHVISSCHIVSSSYGLCLEKINLDFCPIFVITVQQKAVGLVLHPSPRWAAGRGSELQHPASSEWHSDCCGEEVLSRPVPTRPISPLPRIPNLLTGKTLLARTRSFYTQREQSPIVSGDKMVPIKDENPMPTR